MGMDYSGAIDDCECESCVGKLRAEIERLRADACRAADEIEQLREQVQHWRIKAECYGNIVHGCSPSLEAAGFPVDSVAITFRSLSNGGSVGGIRRAVEKMTKEIERLKMAALK